MELTGLAALVVVAAAMVLVVRGWDVRLVLLAAALLIASVAGVGRGSDWWRPLADVVREFLGTFSNEKFVVPICSAMGFAYVLRHTGCERHLVLLLVKPLRHVRWLLVPGVVLVGFLVNVPVISQTSTAVCIGPVVVPLMRAAGYSMATIGACLLLGASVGGELLNPGAPELLTVESKTGVSTVVQAQRYLPPLVFIQLGVAAAVCWAMSRRWERHASDPRTKPEVGRVEESSTKPDAPQQNASARPESVPPSHDHLAAAGRRVSSQSLLDPTYVNSTSTPSEPINPLKALVPLVPLAILFASGLPEPLKLFDVPDDWVMPLKNGKRDPGYNSRLIGLAMLVGVLAAAVVTPNKARDCAKQFFEGAGHGFATIVSLIVTAMCFAKAIETAGLASAVGAVIARAPGLMHPLAAFVPLAFAALSGSGMASTSGLYGFFHDPAVRMGLDPTAVGAMVSLGSAAGRTMSPVAAVTLMCGTLTGTNPFTLAKRVALPLSAGMVVVVVLRMCGVV